MTVEELKAAARELGYKVVKIERKVKLLPCVCGATRRNHRYAWMTNCEILECPKCGRRAAGRTEEEAKRNWNLMIMDAQGEEWEGIHR